LILELELQGIITLLYYRYAISPRHPDQDGKNRDGSDDQKTPTAILFDNNK